MKRIDTGLGITVEISEDGCCAAVFSSLWDGTENKYKQAVRKTIQTIILGHARAGIDVAAPQYTQTIKELIQSVEKQSE